MLQGQEVKTGHRFLERKLRAADDPLQGRGLVQEQQRCRERERQARDEALAHQGLQESENGQELPQVNGDALSLQPFLIMQDQGAQRQESIGLGRGRYVKTRLDKVLAE